MEDIIKKEKEKLDLLCSKLTGKSYLEQKDLLNSIFVQSEYINQLASLDYMDKTLSPKYYTVTDVFKHYEGTREYDGIVAVIQKWYYGDLVKESWCATSMCWALAQLGLRAYTIGGKYENVYYLNEALKNGVSQGQCQSVSIYDMEYGDIVILNFDNTFSVTSNKHVTSYVREDNDKWFYGLGGNQSDGIFEGRYSRGHIVAVYRPYYDKGTLKNIDKLPKG